MRAEPTHAEDCVRFCGRGSFGAVQVGMLHALVEHGVEADFVGAITSNTPVKVAVALGARRLVVLPTGFACALEDPPMGAVANALHALTLLIARQLVAELELLDSSIDFAIVPTLCPRTGSAYDFSRSAELMASAAGSTRQWIAGGGLDRREIPDALRAHSHSH